MKIYLLYPSWSRYKETQDVQFFLDKSFALESKKKEDDFYRNDTCMILERIKLNSSINKKARKYYYKIVFGLTTKPGNNKMTSVVIDIKSIENYSNQNTAVWTNFSCDINDNDIKYGRSLIVIIPIISSSSNEKLVKALAYIKLKNYLKTISKEMLKYYQTDIEHLIPTYSLLGTINYIKK